MSDSTAQRQAVAKLAATKHTTATKRTAFATQAAAGEKAILAKKAGGAKVAGATGTTVSARPGATGKPAAAPRPQSRASRIHGSEEDGHEVPILKRCLLWAPRSNEMRKLKKQLESAKPAAGRPALPIRKAENKPLQGARD